MRKILLLLVLLFAVGVSAQFQLFQLIGSQDSDLLSLNQNPVFISGQSNPLCAQGVCNLIQATYVVGGGNDIVVGGIGASPVGSTDTVSSQPSGVPSDFSNANFVISAKKAKMRTMISLTGGPATSIFNFAASNAAMNYNYFSGNAGSWDQFSPMGYNGWYSAGDLTQTITDTMWGAISRRDSLRREMATNYFNECHTRPDFVSYAWNEEEDTSSCNWLGCRYSPRISYECVTQQVGTVKPVKVPGAKSLDYQIDWLLTNNQNQETEVVSMTQADNVKLIRFSGIRNVASLRSAGTVGTSSLPIDFSGDRFLLNGNRYWAVDGSQVETFRGTFSNMRNIGTNGLMNSRGQISNLDNLAHSAAQQHNNIVAGSSDKINNYFPFVYNQGLDSIEVDSGAEYNLLFSLTVDADWLGIIRNNADFSLECGNGVSGYTGSPVDSSVTIHNTSSVSGSVTWSYSCPVGSHSESFTVPPGQSVQKTVTLNGSQAGTGGCIQQIKYPDEQVKTCTIAYNFIQRPPEILCGNNILDSGENCDTCAQDVRATGGTCLIGPGPNCGNGVLEQGEDCTTCPADFETVNGTGTCQGGVAWWVWVIGGIVVIIGIGTIFVGGQNEGWW